MCIDDKLREISTCSQCGHVGYAVESTNVFTQSVADETGYRILFEFIVVCPDCGHTGMRRYLGRTHIDTGPIADEKFAVIDAEILLRESAK